MNDTPKPKTATLDDRETWADFRAEAEQRKREKASANQETAHADQTRPPAASRDV
jgi:hypothetical protein